LCVIFAFLAGYFLGVNLVFPADVKKLFRDASDTGYFAAVISLATLERLERATWTARSGCLLKTLRCIAGHMCRTLIQS